MNARFMGVIALAAGLLLPAAALAQPSAANSSSPADSTAVVKQLQRQERMDEYKAKFWTQEPITQQEYYDQANEDRQLIAKISAGQPVSNDGLADALKRVDTDY